MQTHDDRDSPQPSAGERYLRSQLERKAEQMTARSENLLTAGKPGEEPLRDMRGKLFVRRLPADEHGLLRVSVGRLPAFPNESGYLTFRGDPAAVLALLKDAVEDVRDFLRLPQ